MRPRTRRAYALTIGLLMTWRLNALARRVEARYARSITRRNNP